MPMTTAAQEAVLEGIKQAAEEITQAEQAASGLVDGLTTLAALSENDKGAQPLAFNKSVKKGTSDVVLETTIPGKTADGAVYGTPSYPTVSITVHPSGSIELDGEVIGEDRYAVMDDETKEYRSLNLEEKTESILKNLGHKAVQHQLIKLG